MKWYDQEISQVIENRKTGLRLCSTRSSASSMSTKLTTIPAGAQGDGAPVGCEGEWVFVYAGGYTADETNACGFTQAILSIRGSAG